jgi:hypothetical protein
VGRKIIVAVFTCGFIFFGFGIGESQAQVDTATSGSMIKDAVSDRVQAIKDRKQEIQEERAARKAEFSVRLQSIKDEVKRKIVERVDGRMESINLAVTNRFSNILVKLQGILDNLIGKAEEAKLQGKDTADLDKSISAAQAAIDNAEITIAGQAINIYTIEIASESALKANVGEIVSQFRSDLKEVHGLVVDAKQGVQNVVMELARLRGVKMEKENTATSSSQ